MKKIYLSILIFIILFFVFNKESYGENYIYYSGTEFLIESNPNTFCIKTYSDYSRNNEILLPLVFYGNTYAYSSVKCYFEFIANGSVLTYSSSKTDIISFNGSPVGYSKFLDKTSASSFLDNYQAASYDDNIGALMNLDMSIVYKLSTGVQARLNWNMPDNVDHVKLVITGTKQTNTYELTGLSYWFNLSDYGNLDDTVHVYLTPYDSDGNWGNTMIISTVVDPIIASYLAQSYKGYYRRVTNPAGSGYVDIIGTSDIDVDVVVEKPDSNNQLPSSPTIVRNYHSYSPVFEYNTTNENYYQEVINYYVTNNKVVNNYYDTTINNIDLSTSITVDYDAYFDIDNVTQTCEDIKDEIHQTGNDFSDLFSLFDVVCPFFGGVGAKAFTLFKWVIGIVGGFVGIKILKAFL